MKRLIFLASVVLLCSCRRQQPKAPEDTSMDLETLFAEMHGCPQKPGIKKRSETDDQKVMEVSACGKSEVFHCVGDVCYAPRQLAVRRHAKENNCQESDVKAKELRSGAWKVTGCGQQQLYACGTEESPGGCVATDNVGKGDSRFGTCFAVSADGDVLTAAHVVTDAAVVEVAMIGSDFQVAEVKKLSEEDDLALLKIDAKTPQFLQVEAQGQTGVGDRVFTMGFPVQTWLGVEPKYTDGAVSALRVGDGSLPFLQTTTPIQPGNSGGPLLNEEGFVVGVVTATAKVETFFKATGALPQGVNFAIKSDKLRKTIGNLVDPPEVPKERKEILALVRSSLCAVRTDWDEANSN